MLDRRVDSTKNRYSKYLLRCSVAALFATLAACSSSGQVGPQAVAGQTPNGTVTMHQVQVAYIDSAGGGSGTLYYQGQTYPFNVAGLGIGGLGASTLNASGEVYKLGNLSQFAGNYAQGRYGFAFGNRSGGAICGCRTRLALSCMSRLNAKG
jgi:hypothetical protein